MAKKNKIDKWEAQHRRNLRAYERQIEEIYLEAVREAASISTILGDFSPDKPFSFSDYPITQQRVDKWLKQLENDVYVAIVNGVRSEWTLANNKNNELCNQVFGDAVGSLTGSQYKRYYSTNSRAEEAFLARKDNGLNLSDRVWNYTEQFKQEIEMGLDLGLRDGLSADEMSRSLRQFLVHPDKLFRRVRDEHGVLQLSKAAKAFHPGRGVYRSSYKNARRLAATETNMAYRTADHERWKQLDFVVGIEVKLSNNHPVPDICDELKGRYPKDFKYVGWHPHCRCYAVSILKTREEMMRDNERILAGEPVSTESVNAVKDVPQGFKDWLDTNNSRINRSSTQPYFLTDNPKYTGVPPRMGKGGRTMTGTKLGRSATKAAYKEYEDSQPTVLTPAQGEQMGRIAADMGLSGYKPMSFFEADEGRANVNFGRGIAYSENCQCCVALHEARLRGLNLTAVGYSGNAGSITKRLGDSFQDIWVNAKTGKTPQITTLRADTEEALLDKLNKLTAANGRYHIGINFRDNTGHIITAERLASGNLLFYDAQSGNFLNIKEFTALESFEVLKVDKLLFNEEMLRAISQII